MIFYRVFHKDLDHTKSTNLTFFPTIWEFAKVKEFNLCHKNEFHYFYIIATKCCRPLIFQTKNSVRQNNE